MLATTYAPTRERVSTPVAQARDPVLCVLPPRWRPQNQDVIAALTECGGIGTAADVHAVLRHHLGHDFPRLAVNRALCDMARRRGRLICTARATYAIAGLPFAYGWPPPKVRNVAWCDIKPPPPEPGTLAWCLAQFQADAVIKEHAPRTILGYTYVLKPLIALGIMPREITTDHLRALLQGKPSSRSTARSQVRAFFRYCVDQGWIDTNPADRLPKITAEPPDKMPLTPHEIAALFDAAEKRDAAHGYAHPTSRLVMVMLLQGLRRKEACGIRWRDIDWDAGSVAIPLTKGRKPHASIPLLPDLRAELERARPHAGSLDEHVLLHGDETLYRRVDELRRATGIDRLTPHLFRHTWASRFLLAGGDLIALQRLGGWSDLTLIQQRYTRLVQQQHALDRGRELDIGGRMLHAAQPVAPDTMEAALMAALQRPETRARVLAAFLGALAGDSVPA